jgi:signal peptidase I
LIEHVGLAVVRVLKQIPEPIMNSDAVIARARRLFRDWLPSLLLLSLILVARSTLADHYHVPSGSMEHALLPGDHVVVNKAAYGLRIPFTKQVVALERKPERGEIVIFDSPTDGIRLIKRVVAVGGDEVEVRAGRVLINGQVLTQSGVPGTERYGSREVHLNLGRGGGPDLPLMRVPQGQVLVLGDHRGNSRDGRYFGTVPVSELYGRASGVFWRGSEGPLWQSL